MKLGFLSWIWAKTKKVGLLFRPVPGRFGSRHRYLVEGSACPAPFSTKSKGKGKGRMRIAMTGCLTVFLAGAPLVLHAQALRNVPLRINMGGTNTEDSYGRT